MNEIYAVTGALGFLGNAIVDNLLSKGKTVRVLDIGQDKHDLLKGKSVTFYKGDICLTSSLEDFFKVCIFRKHSDTDFGNIRTA